MTRKIEICVPDIGDFTGVPVIEIPVAVGDVVAKDDTLVVLESDKATLDVPSPHAGRIAELKVAEGDTVNEGSMILMLETVEVADTAPTGPDTTAKAPEPLTDMHIPPPAATPAPPQPKDDVASRVAETNKLAHASPSVRRYARTLGVDLAEVQGSGPNGRITPQDVEVYVKTRMTSPQSESVGIALAGLPPWPQVDFAKFGPVERQPLNRIARISGPALARNAIVIPHVTSFDKADVTGLEEFRKTLNDDAGPEQAKITMLALAIKAVVGALKAHPKFNASLDGDELVSKKYWTIGFAVDTPDGLVVPVVKDADKKGLREIAETLAGLAADARAGKLKPTDMQGATFTISSLGGVGGTNFTPIINAPEVAILGMPRAEMQPVWDGATFQPRLIQPLSLSWDHRVIDGVAAARFLADFAATLNDVRKVTL